MMKELIFKNDPYEMNWVRPDFPYGRAGGALRDKRQCPGGRCGPDGDPDQK